MSTLPKLPFHISVDYLGPVHSLLGEMTKDNQNLLYARNGTGKSFISRAFRYLDIHGQGKAIVDAPRNLVSDEASGGIGRFNFKRGDSMMGSLHLEKSSTKVEVNTYDTIFHVFSEDFVQEELREQEYSINGKIENKISIDSSVINLKASTDLVDKSKSDITKSFDLLKKDFEESKASNLSAKAEVNTRLQEYTQLKVENTINNYADSPEVPEISFAEILLDLQSLKSVPQSPDYPEAVNFVTHHSIDSELIKKCLGRITSLSSVSEQVKAKIDSHRDFYKSGIDMVIEGHKDSCPFCEQDITAPDPKKVIDAYLEYFSDEEEKHKIELRGYYSALTHQEKIIEDTITKVERQKLRFETIKTYLPSQKDASILDLKQEIEAVSASISSLKNAVVNKAKSLAIPSLLPDENLTDKIAILNTAIEVNNKRSSELSRAVSKSDNERKSLQRTACQVFEVEFTRLNWSKIVYLRELVSTFEKNTKDLKDLQDSSPSSDARVRVARTFEFLLKDFFGEKYKFDKDTFVLKRGGFDMDRGPHRTLSDGEKTAIAFCYFIACIHLKVSSDSDYKRIFLVFDDPVTSMSYDYIFTIAQTLKNLNISTKGEVSINPGIVDGKKYLRPELLILTHSSYFFNILVSNRVIGDNSAFALDVSEGVHQLTKLKKYMAPFQEQLREVYEVSNGKIPSHSTANAIRSVLEAIGRFCRPDKSDSLTNFIQHLASDDGMILKSVLINSFSHGTYYDEIPTPDDLKTACNETMEVVKKYAVGQLEVIKGLEAKVT